MEIPTPLLFKEGWTRPKENIAKPPQPERTGWLNRRNSTTLKAARYRACAPRPSAPFKGTGGIFLVGAATPPWKGGESRFSYRESIHTYDHIRARPSPQPSAPAA